MNNVLQPKIISTVITGSSRKGGYKKHPLLILGSTFIGIIIWTQKRALNMFENMFEKL